MKKRHLTIETNPIYALINAARAEYTRRMVDKPREAMPSFEDFVFELCQVARELRLTRNWHINSTLPGDGTLHQWRAHLHRNMT